MGIRHFFDREVVVYRLRDTTGDKQAVSSTATADCHIQELDAETRQALGMLEERAWIAYFDEDADVKEGDILTDQKTGTEYRVIDVTLKDYEFGINQHLEVRMVLYSD